MARYILIPVLFFLFGPACASTLTTPTYTIEIQQNCTEGKVSCDNVTYTSTNRTNGKRIKLSGKTIHSACADGFTPCGFQGYEFRDGATSYTVLEDGYLLIMQGEKVVLQEKGKWD